MSSRRSVALIALVVAATAFAGCVGNPLTQNASTDGAAATATRMLQSPPGGDVEPTGDVKEFSLYLHPMPDHELYPGSRMPMWGFSLSEDPDTAQFPGPTLRVTEGDRVIVRFRPLVADFTHTIHWHGQHVPWDMDGVPYLSQEPVAAGQEFVYDFVAKPAGTYWYHCHVDVQHHMDMGMYGAFIVDPRDPADDPPFDEEFIMILDEMDKYHIEGGNPQTQNTPQSGDPYDWIEYTQRTSQDAVNRNSRVQDAYGTSNTTLRPERDWYPETYAPYDVDLNTFLINGFAFPYTPTVHITDGKTLRIRMINAGDQVHTMHLHGHHWLVTHKDGVLLENPYWADSVLIGPGERYDLYVVGNNPGVWDLHDHMATNTKNDNIWPGGMMTMLVYESFANQVEGGAGHDHGSAFTTRDPDVSHARSGNVAGGAHNGLDVREFSGGYVRWYDLVDRGLLP